MKMLKSKRMIVILGICTTISSPLSAFYPEDSLDTRARSAKQRNSSTTRQDTKKPSQINKEVGRQNVADGVETIKSSALLISAATTLYNASDVLGDEDSPQVKASKNVADGLAVFGYLGALCGTLQSAYGVGQCMTGHCQELLESRAERKAEDQRKQDAINKIVAREEQRARNKIVQNQQVTPKNPSARVNNNGTRPGKRG